MLILMLMESEVTIEMRRGHHQSRGRRGDESLEVARAFDDFNCVGIVFPILRLHLQLQHRPRRLTHQAPAIGGIHALKAKYLTVQHRVSTASIFHSAAVIPFGLECWRLMWNADSAFARTLYSPTMSLHVHLWNDGQKKRLSLRLF